jgi:phosphoribosylanthranilate isomerase
MKIKICGLSRECDIAHVNAAKPDYIGFVFAKSRRQVTADQAENLRGALDPAIIPVGVFVDAPIQDICSLYSRGIIQIAQLHGAEDAAYLAKLKDSCGIPIIKVMRDTALDETAQFLNADYLLFDSGTGGTGKCFDWTKLSSIKRGKAFPPARTVLRASPFSWGFAPNPSIDGALRGVPAEGEADDQAERRAVAGGSLAHRSALPPFESPDLIPWFLAGGINEQNIRQAMTLNPFGIDVSSGAETDGVKDGKKIARLVRAARA